MLGLALVWAFGSDRWGDPVHTHGSLVPFWGEAVRGPIGSVLVYWDVTLLSRFAFSLEQCVRVHFIDAFRHCR